MPYDEILTERIRKFFHGKRVKFEEKKMFGGVCFLVKDKMCVGVQEDRLMARIDPDIYDEALTRKGCREMVFTGKPMKGFVYVEPEGLAGEKNLNAWVQLAFDFNPKAKSSKKKKTASKKTKV